MDAYAEMARGDIGRWYGHRMFFAAPRSVTPSFDEWIKAHWRKFPATDPSAGPIIDQDVPAIDCYL